MKRSDENECRECYLNLEGAVDGDKEGGLTAAWAVFLDLIDFAFGE